MTKCYKKIPNLKLEHKNDLETQETTIHDIIKDLEMLILTKLKFMKT
jgi:hypothetical protein